MFCDFVVLGLKLTTRSFVGISLYIFSLFFLGFRQIQEVVDEMALVKRFVDFPLSTSDFPAFSKTFLTNTVCNMKI